jgi:long-chain acyl-CoA synthetase
MLGAHRHGASSVVGGAPGQPGDEPRQHSRLPAHGSNVRKPPCAASPNPYDAAVEARRTPATLLDLVDGAMTRYADRPAVGLWLERGLAERWTYRELDRRARVAAWRLRELGLEPGDRLLTWAPSSPALAAVYLGAIRARLILVPLDLRMSADAVAGIRARAQPRLLAFDPGPDGPTDGPAFDALAGLSRVSIVDLVAEPDPGVGAGPADPGPTAAQADPPADWAAQVAAWERARPGDVWDLIFTSGTTGTPKGVMIAHDNLVATIEAIHRIIPPLEHRILSVLPLSHLFEQAIGLLYALDVGADILYVPSRNPRVIFDALRAHRVTSMIAVPQVLDLFWSAIEREVERSGRTATFERLRRIARHLPYPARRRLFGQVHRRLGGSLQLFVSSGAFLPPALQEAWEDLGVTVIQGYGSTENGFGTCNTREDHGLGTVGRPVPPVELRIGDDGEVLFRGPTLFKGYWHDPEATARAIDPEGWYHSGDLGHVDASGRLVLSGRTKDRIVLPNGFNVYPEDIENALRNAGVRDAIVLETAPGRIEAVVLPAAADGIAAAIRSANATLGPNQRLAGWRPWRDDDFPRTHTLKIRRDEVRRGLGLR